MRGGTRRPNEQLAPTESGSASIGPRGARLEALSPPVSAMCVRKNRNCPAQAVTAVQATQVPCSTRGAAQSVTPRRSGRSTQAVLTRITQNTKGDFGATPSEHHVCVLLSTVPVLNVTH